MSIAMTRTTSRPWLALIAVLAVALASSACSTIEYGVKEKFNVYKSDILVSDVGKARKSQEDAREQFKDALEQFGTVVNIEETGLKKAYNRLNDEYEDSEAAAEEVRDRIQDVENVSDDLFKEWNKEIRQYTDRSLARDSERRLKETRVRYGEMLASMKVAERSMQPVLDRFLDNVLYLKHNLNAQAVGSLRGTFTALEGDIGRLVAQMNRSIESSDQFIAEMKRSPQ